MKHLQKIQNDTLSQHDIASLCAYLLVHFFKIHPFNDGNGRTARSLIRIFARSYHYDFDFKIPVRRGNQKYLKSLRTAHRAHRRRDGRISLQSCRYLTSLLLRYIKPFKKYTEDLAPKGSE